MVNSDQTWRKWSNEYKYFYDLAFLKFAEKWNKPKFVYGASLGINIWNYNKSDEEIAKSLSYLIFSTLYKLFEFNRKL